MAQEKTGGSRSSSSRAQGCSAIAPRRRALPRRMRGMTRSVVLLWVVCVAGCTAAPPAPAPSTVAASAAVPAAAPAAVPAAELASLSPADLDRYVAAVVEAQHAVGVTVGVMHQGHLIFAKGYGLANVAAKTPVAPDTLFAIGSVTKQFTCAVALQLQQEGKLSFADPVAK